MARIPYLTLAQMDKEARDVLQGRYGAGEPIHNMRALSASPTMTARLVDVLTYFNRGGTDLDPKAVELVMLKIQQLNNCPYAFGRHTIGGLNHGLSKEQIKQLRNYKSSSVYSDFERDVIQFAEEMTVDKRVSESLFWKMRRVLPLDQLVDLITLCGLYNAVSRIMNAFELDPEDEAMRVLEWAW
jgi:AhpD family alkylhydroperoxidase